jgi:RNase adapter protein RapZ
MAILNTVSSFSFKHGAPPADAALILDCRVMRNPHFVSGLKDLDGRSSAVQEYVRTDPNFKVLFDAALAVMLKGEPVAFGCFGGRHRSVAMAELVGREVETLGTRVAIVHRALQ